MTDSVDRRGFLKIAGSTLGFGALYRFAPALGGTRGRRALRRRARTPQRGGADAVHVRPALRHPRRTQGPQNPLGTRAFELAVDAINALPSRPELALFTGDLTHDSEDAGEHADRMRQFRKIAAGLKVPLVRFVPGEHDAGLDGGALFRDAFGESSYSFDHRGVHFVALDNVSRGKPSIGEDQLALAREGPRALSRSAPSSSSPIGRSSTSVPTGSGSRRTATGS